VILKTLIPILAALWLGLASPAVLAAPAAASDASGVRAPGKTGPRASHTPTSQAAQQAAQQAANAPSVNRDQYALRPERDVQPRSSFGLRMKPGWQQQDDPGR
jgi:hypothetical protein